MNSHIIAIGGGGFLTSSEPALDSLVLEQCEAPRPRVGFVATASGDAPYAIAKFYARFGSLDCRPSHLPLFDRAPNLEQWINSQDVIYVGGGNTRSMLAVWEAWGLPALLKGATNDGTILAGVSAGAICWFEWGVTDSMDAGLAPIKCLELIEGSCCPHFSVDAERRPAFEKLVGTGIIPNGVAIDDGAAVQFVNGIATRVVTDRPGASAYQVSKAKDGVTVDRLGS